jgi:hypothetical protein
MRRPVVKTGKQIAVIAIGLTISQGGPDAQCWDGDGEAALAVMLGHGVNGQLRPLQLLAEAHFLDLFIGELFPVH